MLSLDELRIEIIRIREVVDSIEVRGKNNRMQVDYVYNKCEQLLHQIEGVIQEIQNGKTEQTDKNAAVSMNDMEGAECCVIDL